MKKQILLISFLMLSLNLFSQVDTTKVCIPTNIARLAAKDLIRYDGCKQELQLTQNRINEILEREKQKDIQIQLWEKQDNNSQFMLTQKDAQIAQYEKLTQDLQKELKSVRNRLIPWKVATFAGVLTTGYLLIKK